MRTLTLTHPETGYKLVLPLHLLRSTRNVHGGGTALRFSQYAGDEPPLRWRTSCFFLRPYVEVKEQPWEVRDLIFSGELGLQDD